MSKKPKKPKPKKPHTFCVGCRDWVTLNQLQEAEDYILESSKSGRYKAKKGKCPKGHTVIIPIRKID